MIKIEAVEEMMDAKKELEYKIIYLAAALKTDLSGKARKAARAQMLIFREELKEIDEMMVAEYEEMHIGSVMMDIYQAQHPDRPLNKYQQHKARALPANTLRAPYKQSLMKRILRFFRL